MTPVPPLRRTLAALAVLAALALPAADGGARTLSEADPVYAERLAAVSALEREVTDYTRRIAEIERRQVELAEYANDLGGRVEALKKGSGGIMHDTRLQDALKEARQVLATLNNLTTLKRTLTTTLRTRHVALVRAASEEADRLLGLAEAAVRAGDHDDATVRFEAAIDLLMMGGATYPSEPPAATPDPLPDPLPRFDLSGHERPDDFRGLALVLRDAADRLKWNLSVRTQTLGRLKAERQTLTALIALKPPGIAPEPQSLKDLDARIAEVGDDLARVRGRIVGMFAQAAILETQADREEAALIQEAVSMRRPSP